MFNAWATACSVRTTTWGSRQMTWLHCMAVNVAEIAPDEPTRMMAVLIPAHHVTAIRPGPTFQLTRSQHPEDLGVFPPSPFAPPDSLPLAEVERILAELLAPQRN
jgi:hypothetical protein